ncbi:hypothetical protein [Legionella spiritensis]|uniref:Uncharacterized protein n=1 Tax=Legionella spiritensis TaxID=452 RepID=A0A0W0YZR1_LEGSP|nr:hypothetical protein [Legionella spiritensis]KTD62006.1 hypothetical protein Lspi_1856 [Legionella spiritensis]SNV34819.1 Uncharacterised protein [Legionella spiritensis]
MIYLLLLIAFVALFVFIILLDPYGLYRGRTEEKRLPYYTWHHYNALKQHKNVDLGLLGSSAINYYDKKTFLNHYKNIFFMGVESSNIKEHLAYGRLLFDKKPRKIIFFYTFYALNPARGFQLEFKPNMVKYNNFFIDVFYQYLNKRALKDSWHYFIHLMKQGSNNTKLFFNDGRRTQLHYLNRSNYVFDDVLADYIAAMSIDPHYYNSERFKNPDSLNQGFELIKQFKEDAENLGIELQFVATPVYRTTLALKYFMGLGETYERYREEMLKIGEYIDLNLDMAFVSDPQNWWDTHHTRRGEYLSRMIVNNLYLVNSNNLEETTRLLRPTEEEIARVEKILDEYKRWDYMKEKINKRIELVPPIQ